MSTTTTMPTEVDVLVQGRNGRELVRSVLLAVNSKSVYVRLPANWGGKVIKRRVLRDVPGWRPGQGKALAQPIESTEHEGEGNNGVAQ